MSEHDCHRTMAAEMFNRTWDLLDAGERTPEADRRLLAAAYASYAHWREVGTPKNHSVSDWQVSRVWAALGDAGHAAEYGAEALRIAEEHDLGAFYVAYGHEALARAATLRGDAAERDRRLAAAEAMLDDIDEAESAELIRNDLEAIRAL
ncbi:MAG TPA: hypothetical protein VLG28_02620 [Acidimicrobiia bacterium]|jgi:hypothetical protein|nr:hypothetical protein [Acidimicrobiia bacterium]